MTVNASEPAVVATPVLASPGWKARIAGSVMRPPPGRTSRFRVGSCLARVGSAQRLTWSRQAWSEPPAYQASTNRAVTSRAAASSFSGTYPEAAPSIVVVTGTPITIAVLDDEVAGSRLGWSDGVMPY